MSSLVDDGVLTIDRDGMVAGHNIAFLKLLGYRTSLEGSNLLSLFLSADRTALECEFVELLNAKKGAKSFVGMLLHDSGRYMSFELEFRLEPTLELILCRIMHQSESQRSRDIIQRREAATGIETWELDLTSGDIYWSAQTHQIHETDPSSYQPDPQNALTFYHRDSIPTLTEAIKNLMLTGEP